MNALRNRLAGARTFRARREGLALAALVAAQVAVLLTLPSSGASAVGVTYVVSPAGVDTNPGTPSQPWRTITRALRADSPAGAGDTVLIKAGRYDENVVNTRSGAAGKPLVITGESGTNVHPVKDQGWAGGVFATNGTHDLVIQNLTLIADTATCGLGSRSLTFTTSSCRATPRRAVGRRGSSCSHRPVPATSPTATSRSSTTRSKTST